MKNKINKNIIHGLSDLKVGYLVESSSGLLGMVCGYGDDTFPSLALQIGCNKLLYDSAIALYNYNEDFSSKKFNSLFEIEKIYGYSKEWSDSGLLNSYNRPLLWEKEKTE